ncbi:hypothetical protein ACU8KH_03798 [Lachancea thermotolerans]
MAQSEPGSAFLASLAPPGQPQAAPSASRDAERPPRLRNSTQKSGRKLQAPHAIN